MANSIYTRFVPRQIIKRFESYMDERSPNLYGIMAKLKNRRLGIHCVKNDNEKLFKIQTVRLTNEKKRTPGTRYWQLKRFKQVHINEMLLSEDGLRVLVDIATHILSEIDENNSQPK